MRIRLRTYALAWFLRVTGGTVIWPGRLIVRSGKNGCGPYLLAAFIDE